MQFDAKSIPIIATEANAFANRWRPEPHTVIARMVSG